MSWRKLGWGNLLEANNSKIYCKVYSLFGTFAKVWKKTISFFMSVYLSLCLSVRMEELSSHWTIFMKFIIREYFGILLRKIKFH